VKSDWITLAAALSQAAYLEDLQRVEEVLADPNIKGLKQINCDKSDTQAYILLDSQRGLILIAIPGTASTTDILTDINAWRTCVIYRDVKINVHAGGRIAVLSLIETVMTVIREHPRKDILVTGHSLGGLITQQLALEIYNRYGAYGRKINTVTFGQPRAGNGAFKKALEAIPGEHLRFYNAADPVTWVPGLISSVFPFGRYKHAGEGMQIGDSLSHSMTRYAERIQELWGSA